jgi:fructosamine-3-kinase
MFGFHTTTCQGATPQDIKWESSRTIFFTKLLQHILARDTNVNGPWTDLEVLSQRAIDIVIPRLVGVLERDGRNVKPNLIHADLWEENTGSPTSSSSSLSSPSSAEMGGSISSDRVHIPAIMTRLE